MYLIPIARPCDNKEGNGSEDPGDILCEDASKKLTTDNRKLKESEVSEALSHVETHSFGCSDVQEGARPFSSRAISSENYYHECGWDVGNSSARRDVESSDIGRLDSYIRASRRSWRKQRNLESMDSLKYEHRKRLAAGFGRNSSDLNCNNYQDERMQTRSSCRGWEDNKESLDIRSSAARSQLKSSMKTSPRQQPVQGKPTYWQQKEVSFESLDPQQRQQPFSGSVHTNLHSPNYFSDSFYDESEGLLSDCENKGSRRWQRFPSIQQAGNMENTKLSVEAQKWCTGEKRTTHELNSPRLRRRQGWTVNPRLARLETSGHMKEKTCSRGSAATNTGPNWKRDRGGKSRPSYRNLQPHCIRDGITTEVKSRREYAVACRPTSTPRASRVKRKRQVSGDLQGTFHRNLGKNTSGSNEEDCSKFSNKSISRSSLEKFKAAWADDPIAARLRQRSVKLSNMNDSDSGTGSSDYEEDHEESSSQPCTPEHKISIKLPTICRKERVNRPLATTTNEETPDARCIQLDKLIKIETNKHLGEVLMSDKEILHAAEVKKATQYLITRKVTHKKEIPVTPHFRQTNVYHPCYIADTVGKVMGFLSLIEIVKAKRVSKVWEIAANSTLRRRTVDNLNINPPRSAEAGSMMLSQLHIFLPRLQCLTISIKNFKHLKGLVLSYICECKNLVFLRVENFAWRDLTIATQVILSLRDPGNHGHPILNTLQDLELPDSKLPIPTSTQCIRPLSKLAPNLRSLTVKSAQDPIIFSLRLFFPTVRNLFLLDTLWTTRRFAQIISSSPHLMKFLMDGQKVRMLTPIVTGGSGMYISSPGSSTQSDRTSIPHTPRIHSLGSVPVTPSDDRLTPLISNHKESLYVEPLGRVKQIETGNDLTKANIGMFAGFCALIGVLIIMPPMDGQE